MMEKIKTNRIKLADLRFFDAEHNGIELSDSLSKGILVDVDGNGNYSNLFCLGEAYPVFKRAPISNVTSGGLSYGTKVYHVSNELVTGPCWVLTSCDFAKFFKNSEVSLETLENYVLAAEEFFKDRISIAEKRISNGKNIAKMSGIIKKDEEARNLMNDFFGEREKAVQKVKED